WRSGPGRASPGGRHEPGGDRPEVRPVTALRVAYVVGTVAGGTGGAVAVLGPGCPGGGVAGDRFWPAPRPGGGFPRPGATAARPGGRFFPGREQAAAGQVAVERRGPAAARGPAETPGLAATWGPAGPGERPGSGVAFVPLEIAERPWLARDARAVLRLRHLLARSHADVVHAHG